MEKCVGLPQSFSLVCRKELDCKSQLYLFLEHHPSWQIQETIRDTTNWQRWQRHWPYTTSSVEARSLSFLERFWEILLNPLNISLTSRKNIKNEKSSRNGTGRKSNETRYRNVTWCSHIYMLTGFCLTIQYQGDCGLIEGHAYSVVLLPITVCTCQFKYIHAHTSIVCAAVQRCTAVLLSVNHEFETWE